MTRYCLFLFAFASGLAALIYEIVWFQVLELVIGSSPVSLTVILATFMGGTCLGSLIFPHVVSVRNKSLLVYGAIEIGIAALAIVILFVMPFVGTLYTAWSGTGIAGLLLRGAVAAACLLPPTLLMGSTLPALARRIGTPSDVSGLGYIYACNIGGAVSGCLVAGFYLLPKYDVTTATYVAAAINVAVGGMALALSSPDTDSGRVGTAESGDVRVDGSGLVYLTIALSGFCALAAEAIWTRVLGLLFGASAYTLSIILAVFLFGLGIGSGIASLAARAMTRPRVALGWCQLLVAGAIAWTSYGLSASLPYWPVNPSIASNISYNFQLDLDRALWALLPPTLMWGASFSLALAAIERRNRDSAILMARIYAANTVGALLGAIAALFLIPWAGSQRAEQLIIVLSVVAGLVLVLPAIRRGVAVWGLVGLLAGGLFVYCVPPISKPLIAHGRFAATWVGKSEILYAGEGMNSSVAVSSFPTGALTFHVAGKIQASNVPRDMRLQRMLGHLTSLIPATPRSVLVIGCGAGITAGAVSIDPAVERVTIVEIEPLVPDAAARYFGAQNFEVVHSPKVRIHIDDGRHYLLTTPERFDAVTADPLDPWVKGAASLYTKEFLEGLREHLNPGGIVTIYVQLFETTEDAVKSTIATFFEVFPTGTIWGNTYEGKGHDIVLVGQLDTPRIDLDKIERRVNRPEYSRVAQSLREVGMSSSTDLFATYAGRKPDLSVWLSDALLNSDRSLRMQYLAGVGLNLDDSAGIYANMLAYRKFPSDLFTSTEGRVELLRNAVEGQ